VKDVDVLAVGSGDDPVASGDATAANKISSQANDSALPRPGVLYRHMAADNARCQWWTYTAAHATPRTPRCHCSRLTGYLTITRSMFPRSAKFTFMQRQKLTIFTFQRWKVKNNFWRCAETCCA